MGKLNDLSITIGRDNKAEIVFDESRLANDDIFFDTLDLKIRAIEFTK